MKSPAILFYTSDFLTGVMFMSNEQVGKYIKLLCMQHQQGRLSEEDFFSICNRNDKKIIQKFIVDKDGYYFNKRMEEEIEKRSKYSKSRSDNRKIKPLKTKPNNEKHMKNICKTYEKHMENENDNINVYYSNKELDSIFKEFLKVRKKLKAVNSDFAITRLTNKLAKYDDDTKIKMIENSIVSSWKDVYELKGGKKEIKPDWFDKEIETKKPTKESQKKIEDLLNSYS